MDPYNCPSEWVFDPDSVQVDSWTDIPIMNVWQNKNTREVVIQYRVIAAVQKNNCVEYHKDPETVISRINQLKSVFSGSVDAELDSVTATDGREIIACTLESEAFDAAMQYMSRNQ